MSGSTSRASGRWLVFAAAILWGATATVARLAFRDHQVPALTLVVVRLTIACLLLFPWIAWKQPRGFRVERGDWAYLLILAVFGVATVQATYYYSISRLGVGLSILIQYLAPALLVGAEILRGRPTPPVIWAAVLAAVAGTGFLVGGLGDSVRGVRLFDWCVGFASALSFAFFIGYSKRGLQRYSPLTILFYTFLIAGILWSCVTPPWRVLLEGYSPTVWTLFAIIGVGSTLLPFVLFYEGLRRLPAAEAAILATLEPVVAVAMAWIFLEEPLGGMQWLGAVLVLGAAVLVSRQSPEPSAVVTERL